MVVVFLIFGCSFMVLAGVFTCYGCTEDNLRSEGDMFIVIVLFNMLSLITNRIFWICFGWFDGSNLSILKEITD